ncbi:hypothetical protein RhiirA4_485764 [Rhizophagus irregularis]|uniref:Uncharacterized protein n=1 Tax=Rhizophagus irregularis TaxID=588596 RepID=A0A2I1HQT7_9GLOM|nr:hypothetical protein RhiirA4_485764 [Rhizophagus irregularis]
MASSHDFSTLSWDEVLAKIREVDNLRAKCALKKKTLLAQFNSLSDGTSDKGRAYLAFVLLRQLEDSLSDQRYAFYTRLDFLLSTAVSENDIAVPPAIDRPSHDDSVIDDLPPLPLTIWAFNHEDDPSATLALCTPSLQRTNHLRRIRRTPKFLCKCVSSMISPASFKHAQKIQKNLSFTRLVLSSSTIRSLVLSPSTFFRSNDLSIKDIPDSSILPSHISNESSAFDNDHDNDASPPTPVLDCELPSASTSVLPNNNKGLDLPHTFTIRTVLNRCIRPVHNVGSNRLYSTRRNNCYFLLDPTPDSANCYTIHTNSPILHIDDLFHFQSDRLSLNLKFITSALLTQRVTSLARWSFSHQNNRRIRTFIQFRYQQSCFYLGIYFGCPFCKTPAAFVMSHFRHACHIHDKKLIQIPSPPPCPPFTLPCNRVSRRQDDGYCKELTSRRLGVSYRKSYAFHAILQDDNNKSTARTLISYTAHNSIPHPTKKQLARQQRHKALLTDKHKFSRHVVYPDLLDSSMWMAKEPAVVIPPSSYKLTMFTTDSSIVMGVRQLISSRLTSPLVWLNVPTNPQLRLYPPILRARCKK